MWEINPGELFFLGGPLMWPILLCSIFAMGVVVEKLLFFHSIKEDLPALKNKIFEAVSKNDIKQAMIVCDLSGSPIAKVLKSGLSQYGRGRQEVEAAMDGASRFEVHLLEQRLPALAAIGQVAPLLGFLGTVTGMCVLFHTMSVRAQAMNQLVPGNISGGLWQALITTVAGLVVMIPSVLAHSYLVNAEINYIIQMEKAAFDLAHFFDHISGPVQSNDEG